MHTSPSPGEAIGAISAMPHFRPNVDLNLSVQKGKYDVKVVDIELIRCSSALPPNSKVINSVKYGTAAWTQASRIIVALEDGSEQSFFMKVGSEELGKVMIEGEFSSLREIAKYNPALTPIPYAMGEFQDASVPTWFFLMEFLDLDVGAPEPATICKQLAELHANSISPTGKFGFAVTTCHGPHLQNVEWESSWTVFFSRLIRQFFDKEIRVNGPPADGTYEAAFDKLVEVTIPRILDPLQSDGRYLKPSLLHGDLWDENSGTDLKTRQPKIFDASAFYGHNEAEIGIWRRDDVRYGRAHIRQYLRHMPPSEPKEQWDDRNRLYCLRYEISHAMGWPATCQRQREIILGHVLFLNQKYSPETVEGASDGSGTPQA